MLNKGKTQQYPMHASSLEFHQSNSRKLVPALLKAAMVATCHAAPWYWLLNFC